MVRMGDRDLGDRGSFLGGLLGSVLGSGVLHSLLHSNGGLGLEQRCVLLHISPGPLACSLSDLFCALLSAPKP